MRRLTAPLALLLGLVLSSSALAHRERPTEFPDPAQGRVPVVRVTGPYLVVCKSSSRARILRNTRGATRSRNLRLLAQCRYAHVHEAVTAAADGTRILVLPGTYSEEPSRAAPADDPRCASLRISAFLAPSVIVGSYEFQRDCPNAENLIAVVGKRNIQIEGTGDDPDDVQFIGDRNKLNVFRGDRADGLVLRNFTVQYSDFNNVYVLETNGFRLERIVSRWSREYGFLTFSSDHGLYNDVVAYGNGDAGVYPGGVADGHCRRYTIELRNVDSYGNVFGLSGNGGNALWVHESRFHHNVAGALIGSLDPSHPGQPQDCSKWEGNRIFSNNLDVYSAERDAYCLRPKLERDPKLVCPSAPAPIGTGLIILGGNRNLVRNNRFYDNWRAGARLAWVPDVQWSLNSSPDAQWSTSNGNRFLRNRMSVRPDGRRDPNRVDFVWDNEGARNCWQGNRGARGGPTSVPRLLQRCPGRASVGTVDLEQFGELLACATWNPRTNPDPSGCDWFTRPREPNERRARAGMRATSRQAPRRRTSAPAAPPRARG